MQGLSDTELALINPVNKDSVAFYQTISTSVEMLDTQSKYWKIRGK